MSPVNSISSRPTSLAAILILAICIAACPELVAQDRPTAYHASRIHPVDGPPIDAGVLLVHRGKIVAVGAAGAVALPEGTEEIRLPDGSVLIPGLVDTHSHIGAPAGGDGSGPIQPECRVLDSIDVRDPSIKKARAGGITTVNVMSGSGHLISGQTLYLKLRDGGAIEDLLLHGGDGAILGGIKFANGTNSQRPPPFPDTRAKSAALVRAELIKAREYKDKVAASGSDATKRPPRDLRLEALALAIEGKIIVHHHTHRHDDVVTVLRLAEEFGLRVVLHHVSEGWKVAAEIAKAKAPCSVIVLDSPGGKLEAIDLRRETCAILAQAGVLVSIHTDDPITDSRGFLRSGAMAVRGGLPTDEALRALTINGARQLDLEGRVGSLTAGKDADFVLLSGDPFATKTQVLGTWIEGRRVFDLADPEDRLLAYGGYGASHGQRFTDCCGEEVR